VAMLSVLALGAALISVWFAGAVVVVLTEE
jgi:hypothetical protein